MFAELSSAQHCLTLACKGHPLKSTPLNSSSVVAQKMEAYVMIQRVQFFGLQQPSTHVYGGDIDVDYRGDIL